MDASQLPARRRYSYNPPLESYSPSSPLSSTVDYGNASFTSPKFTNQSTNSDPFRNDNWQNDDTLFRTSSPFPSADPVEPPQGNDDDPDIAFYPPKNWGERGINLTVYWTNRLSKAIATFVATHCFLLVAYRLVAVTFFVSGTYSLFWIVPYFLAIGIASLSHCTIYLKDYIKPPSHHTTRFKTFLALFSTQSLAEWLKFTTGGSLIGWVFAAQLGSLYQGPILFTGELNRPDKYTKFLNEEDLYVIFAGMWFGTLIYFQRHFDFSRPRITFPVIQRQNIYEFKARARPTLKKAFKRSVWPAISFTVLYHFVLWDLKNSIVTLSMFLDSCTLEIDRTWYQFFNLRRFLVVYLSGVLIVFSFSMARIIVRMFMIAPQEFGIELFHAEQPDLSLSEALSDSRVPLIRALAFRYLHQVARSPDADGRDRRRKIYSLSPTGDVPAEWRAVKGECLSVIDRLSTQLDGFKELIGLHQTKWSEYIGPVLPRQLALQGMRLRVEREQLLERRKAMGPVDRVRFEFKHLISRIPWLMHVFDNQKENEFLIITKDCQNALNAVKALSFLVAKSVREDRYGVVQQDVPHIMKVLTALRDKLQGFRRVNPLCASYSVLVHRSLVRLWLAFEESYGAEGLKYFR